MLVKNLLLTEIVRVSESELKYKIFDLDSGESFEIVDELNHPYDYRFIRGIFADNVRTPFKDDVRFFNQIIRKNPLFFNAVYLKIDDEGFIQTPMTVEDIAVIPNVDARGFVICKDALMSVSTSLDNLIGDI